MTLVKMSVRLSIRFCRGPSLEEKRHECDSEAWGWAGEVQQSLRILIAETRPSLLLSMADEQQGS